MRVEGWSEIFSNEVSLLVRSPTSGLEWEMVDVPIRGLVLSCQTPKADIVLFVGIKKS